MVTLEDMLSARERRAARQKELVEKHGSAVVSFTMNIAGPKKTSPLIERAFGVGMKLIEDRTPSPLEIEKNLFNTGCEAFMALDMDASYLKSICVDIEESTPLGRLFDMDVTDCRGEKLQRERERGCIVCSAPGRACAAGRLHSPDEIWQVTEKIMRDYFLEADRDTIAKLGVKSLIDEVETTIKPGLVDKANCGSHEDMNLDMFLRSARGLGGYFGNCFEAGYRYRHMAYRDAFDSLRPEGIRAEEHMYEITGGVNTHKGIIFSMGIVCASMGRLWKEDSPGVEEGRLFDMCASLCRESILEEIDALDKNRSRSASYSYARSGIRKEAAEGFPSVREISLPTLRRITDRGYSVDTGARVALLELIARVEDTNLYRRGGKEGQRYASQYARRLLGEKDIPSAEDMEIMDREFIKRNLSPGGCADLLALTYFVHSLENHIFA